MEKSGALRLKGVAKASLKPGMFVWVLFLVLFIVSIFASDVFLRSRNLSQNFFVKPIGLAIATMGQSVVIISGQIDMSIGASVSLLTTLAAALFRDLPGVPPFAVALMMIGAGLLIGALNGFLTVFLRIPAFMATLATMSLLEGIIFFYTKVTIGGIPRGFRFLVESRVGGIPLSFFYLLLIFALLFLLLKKHRFGNALYAVGSDPVVAAMTGIRVKRIKMSAYLLTGLLVALASFFLSSRMGGGGPTTGQGYELDTITAAVIGGVSLSGGRGSLPGAIGGVLILVFFSNLMNLMDVSSYIQTFLKGVVLILAVSFYAKKQNR